MDTFTVCSSLPKTPTKTKKLSFSKSPVTQEIKYILQKITNSKRVVVITGAGISVASGIADFRSKDGIFSRIRTRYPGEFSSGKELFDASLAFSSTKKTAIFHEFMNELQNECANSKPTATHKLIAKLQDRQTLLRCYTQNIDGLESKSGLSVYNFFQNEQSNPQNCKNITSNETSMTKINKEYALSHKVVPLHGVLDTFLCTLCRSPFNQNIQVSTSKKRNPNNKKEILNTTSLQLRLQNLSIDQQSNTNPPLSFGSACPRCIKRSEIREEQGRRSLPIGILRPAVVLYNEPHLYSSELSQFITNDTKSTKNSGPDLILIMGTALTTPGCVHLVRQLANAAHKPKKNRGLVVIVNYTSVSHRVNLPLDLETTNNLNLGPIVDYELLGDVELFSKLVEKEWKTQTSIKQWAKVSKTSNNFINTLESKGQKRKMAKSTVPIENLQLDISFDTNKTRKEFGHEQIKKRKVIYQTNPKTKNTKTRSIINKNLRRSTRLKNVMPLIQISSS
ncbi:hypothetical protein BB558_000578 [Smittium angustum]|uniref:Deacetylase sirtuin-type domain-containing protein n=1 Tax=Smittium angustum TaxID=133377 RepID=A0A2U1JE69_SMIAN|nr:hypothetical protein BB558_000578 [Smittium angustum]